MASSELAQSGARHFKIIDRLTADPTAHDLLPLIAKLRDGPCHISLDTGSVERLSDSALQALAVIHKTQTSRGDRLRIQSPSSAFVTALDRFGFSQLLGAATP